MMIEIAALVLLACFYGAYFTKQIMLRRKGIQTNQMGKGEKPKKTRIIETCLMVATYGNGLIQAASVFLSTYMLPVRFPAPLRVAGLAVAACGVVFFVLAVVVMRDSWRAGVDETQDTSIVTTGVYKYSRNPAFVGFDLLAIGMALAMPGVIVWIGAAVCLVCFHLQILEEEKFLPFLFGEEYARYRQSTPRYLLFF